MSSKNRINQLKVGSILSYLQMGLSIVVGMIYTPLMIRLLGKSEYGLYNTVSSTISMLSLLSLGFNTSYIRYYSKYKVQEDKEAIDNLNGLFLTIFLVIGAIALACGTFLTANLKLVFSDGLTPAELDIAKVLMLLLTVNMAVSFPMSVFQNIISAHERFVFLKLLGMTKTVFSPILTIPLLLLGFGSISIVAITLAVAVLTDIAYLVYAKKRLKVRFAFGKAEEGLFKSILVFTSFIAINMVVDQVNKNMGQFLLARFCGTEAVALYAVGFTLFHYYSAFSTGIAGVFAPRIHRIINTTANDTAKQKNELTGLFTKIGRIQFLLLALVASGLVIFGREFIAFWAGDGYEESYYVTLLLVIPSTIALIQNVGLEVQRALNKHKFRSIAYAVMAAVNLVLTVILCPRYGSVGTAVGTAISYVVANGFIINIYYHKACNIDIIAFWKSILRFTPGIALPVVFGVVIKQFFDFYNVWMMLAGIAAYSGVYFVSMWFFGMDNYEKDLLRKPLRKVLRSRK